MTSASGPPEGRSVASGDRDGQGDGDDPVAPADESGSDGDGEPAARDDGTDGDGGREWRFALDEVGEEADTRPTLEPGSPNPEHVLFVVAGVALAVGIIAGFV